MSLQRLIDDKGTVLFGSHVLQELALASKDPDPEYMLVNKLVQGLRNLGDEKDRTGPLGNGIWGGLGLDPAFWQSASLEVAAKVFYERAVSTLHLPLPNSFEQALRGDWDEFAFVLVEAITTGFTLRAFKDPSFQRLLSNCVAGEPGGGGGTEVADFVRDLTQQLFSVFLSNIDESNRFDFVDMCQEADSIRSKYMQERYCLDLFLLSMITKSTVHSPEIRESVASSLLGVITKQGLETGWISDESGRFRAYCQARFLKYSDSWESSPDRDSRISSLADTVVSAIDEGPSAQDPETDRPNRQYDHRHTCTYIDSTLHNSSERVLKWVEFNLQKYMWIMQKDDPSFS